MPYCDFKTLDQVHKILGINIKSSNELYKHIESVKLSQWFIETMRISYTRAIQINTEHDRQS